MFVYCHFIVIIVMAALLAQVLVLVAVQALVSSALAAGLLLQASAQPCVLVSSALVAELLRLAQASAQPCVLASSALLSSSLCRA
jgi:hypothetical protein